MYTKGTLFTGTCTTQNIIQANLHTRRSTHRHVQHTCIRTLTSTLVPELFPCPSSVETTLISLFLTHTRHTGQRISFLLEKGHLLGELFFCICSMQATQMECPQGSTHHCTQEKGEAEKHPYREQPLTIQHSNLTCH